MTGPLNKIVTANSIRKNITNKRKQLKQKRLRKHKIKKQQPVWALQKISLK